MRHVYRLDDNNKRTEIKYKDIQVGDRIQMRDDNEYLNDIRTNIVRVAIELVEVKHEHCYAWEFKLEIL